MRGLIHRAVLKKGPRKFWEFFPRPSSGERKVVVRHAERGARLIKRSALGLAAVYNGLPSRTTAANDVKSFQRQLQDVLKSCEEGWKTAYSSR